MQRVKCGRDLQSGADALPQRTSQGIRPRWLRISIRSLVILVLLVGGGLGSAVRSARLQHAAVAAIENDGGSVSYDRDWMDGRPSPNINRPWHLNWLEAYVGIDYFSDVTRVFLNGTQSDAKLALVANLPRIEVLEFSDLRWYLREPRNPSVTDGGMACLEGHSRLTELDLCDSNITDFGLFHLRNMVGLRTLDLSRTFVTDAGMACLRGMTGLQHLDLCGTRISDAGLVHLEGMTGLRELGLRSTDISNAGVARLKKLTSLQLLDVYNTKVDDFGVQELRRSLRGVRVIFTSISAR